MYVLTFLVLLFLFLIATFVSFTTVGLILLSFSNHLFSIYQKITFATIIGFVVFTLVSYLFFLINLPLLMYFFLIIVNLLFFKTFLKKEIGSRPPIDLNFSQLILFLIIFVLGVILQLLVIAPSGITQNGDLTFWSSHAHDSMWHIALSNQYIKGTPLINPIFSGERLVNYHFFTDISLAEFHRLFNFPYIQLYFRLFPLLFSVLLGAISYIIGKTIAKSYWGGIWSLIFVFFGGSFGYLVTSLKGESYWGGESLFGATQIQSSIGNPPQIVATFLTLTFLLFFYLYLQKKDYVLLTLATIIIGSLAVFKVYAAVVIFASLAIVSFIRIVKQHQFDLFAAFSSGAILSALLYLPNTANSTSFLIFQPWWFVRVLMITPDRLNWIDSELKRQTYIAESNWKRVIQIELTGLTLFFLGNSGTKLIGLVHFFQAIKQIYHNYFYQLLILITLISFILPLLFVQKGVAGNIIQFLQYFLLTMGLFSALTLSSIFKKIKNGRLKALIILLVILFSVPSQLGLIYHFYNRPAFTKIDSSELLALDFIKTNTPQNASFITPLYNPHLKLDDKTPPIWAWFDTSYFSALTNRTTYLSDFEQLAIMGYDQDSRKETVKQIFETTNLYELQQKLSETKAQYLYFPKLQKPNINLSESSLIKVFENSTIELWKIN